MTSVGSDSLYVLKGNGTPTFWKYELAKETGWTTLASAPYSSGWGVVASNTADDSSLYVLSNIMLMKYNITANTWSTAGLVNVPDSSAGSLVRAGDTMYTFGSGAKFWRYTISTNAWTQMSDAPWEYRLSNDLVIIGSDNIYAFKGGNDSTANAFWKYTISTNTWTVLANTPAPICDTAGLAAVGSDAIYAFGKWGSNEFWKYTISTNTWANVAAAPYRLTNGGNLVAVGNDTIYAFGRDPGDTFHKYTVSTDIWSSMPVAPATVSTGGVLIASSDNKSLYVLRGYNNAGFWKYSTTYSSSGSFTSATLDIGGIWNMGS